MSTISSGKYTSSLTLDPQGDLFAAEYNAGSDKYVLNRYTNAAGTPSQLYSMDYSANFFAWGIVAFNSNNVYFNTGSPASQLGGSLVQYYASPINQAKNITASEQTSTDMTLKWTNGTGEKRVVFVIEGNAGTPSVSNNKTYSANASFGNGSKDGSGNWYCVYNGSDSSVALTNLQANQNYRVMVMDYNGNAGLEQYQTSTATNNPVNLSMATISSIVRADADNTFATTLNYTVTFGSAVSGLSTSNFSLTTSPYITGASVSSVTAVSGSVYTVQVTKNAGSGDLTLNLANVNGLSPVVVSTLPFVGETYHLNTTEVDLASIVPSEGRLDPVFSSDVTSYSITAHSPSITLTPTAVNSTSTITIGAMTVSSGSTSAPIILNEGNNQVIIKITSASSALSKSYTLNIDYVKVLPVTWKDFDVTDQNGNITWAWKLGVESQIAYYAPEYSLDGKNFIQAGKVTDKAPSLNYHFSKALNLEGLVYVRMKAVNNDGSADYSVTKTLQTGKAGSSLVVYPNPVSSQLRLKWPASTASPLHVSVYNIAGKCVLQQDITNASEATLNVGSLAAGSYYLVVEDNQHRRMRSSLFLKK